MEVEIEDLLRKKSQLKILLHQISLVSTLYGNQVQNDELYNEYMKLRKQIVALKISQKRNEKIKQLGI